MNELKVFEKNGQLLTDSREVAKMIGKEHFHLMRDISSYMKVLNGIETEDSDESKIGFVKNSRLKIKPSDFFLESTYPDSKGEIRPCYLLTKKGCDMVANKLTGQKGVLFTAAYVTAFEQMRERIKTGKALPDDESRKLRARAMALNAAN
ncbi:MAG: Rha family transcriptional regulator, partial [Acutalibacteraceae bacterium]